jgi:hypothetical protein
MRLSAMTAVSSFRRTNATVRGGTWRQLAVLLIPKAGTMPARRQAFFPWFAISTQRFALSQRSIRRTGHPDGDVLSNYVSR